MPFPYFRRLTNQRTRNPYKNGFTWKLFKKHYRKGNLKPILGK